jgi:hypothetical protein
MVDLPTLVKEVLEVFGNLSDNEPVRRHLPNPQREVTQHKTISGINRACFP